MNNAEVLLIEDEQGIIRFLKKGLEEEGYNVDFAEDGETGVAMFQNKAYKIVLLDWMLPKLNGLEVCQKIRIVNAEVPIIFLTAKDTVEDVIEGLRAGANDYIRKPFSFEELLARVGAQLRNKDSTLTKYTLGKILLNVSTHETFLEGRLIHLTQKEFQLLEYLLKNKGKICTREAIIKDVWNINFEYDTGIIDVFMNGIRKKLSLAKDDKLIKSVRGIGYIANDKNEDNDI